MKNFFMGLMVMLVGSVIGYVSRTVIPYIITGTTSVGDVLYTTFVLIALFFIIFVLGILVMIGKKSVGNNKRQ